MNDSSFQWNETHFDTMSWHDNYVHGLVIRGGQNGDGELELDIDYIKEWLPPVDKQFRWRIAPATLTFLNVFHLKLEVDYSGFAIGPFQLSGIDRQQPSSGHSRWSIRVAYPEGAISFSASGFRQVLRAEPIVHDEQILRSDRS